MNALLLGKIRAMTDKALVKAIHTTLSFGAWRDALIAEANRRKLSF